MENKRAPTNRTKGLTLRYKQIRTPIPLALCTRNPSLSLITFCKFVLHPSPMAILGLSLLFFLVTGFRAAYGDNYGWEGGHATFYGGGDASGTMGMVKLNNLIWVSSFVFVLLHFFSVTPFLSEKEGGKKKKNKKRNVRCRLD